MSSYAPPDDRHHGGGAFGKSRLAKSLANLRQSPELRKKVLNGM
jgi:hypothetical protein